MLPVAELRGGIPFGIGVGLPWYLVFLISVTGNIIVVPFIIIFMKSLLGWMRICKIEFFSKIANWFYKKAEKNKPKIDKYGGWGLFLFVAIPLPGTGAWTGAIVASLFDMNKKKAYLSIFGGVLVAGITVTLISMGVLGFLSFLL
jgi:uncharacterized membrane protein